jgi:integrase/recombinase XerC
MIDFQAGVDSFCEYLRLERQASVHTIQARRRDLAKVIAYCKACHIPDWSSFEAANMRGLVAKMNENGQEANSVKRLMSSVRRLFRHLKLQNVIADGHNPLHKVDTPKGHKRLPRHLLSYESGDMLDAEVEDTFIARRDHAIVELFYSSGLRLTELVNLDMEHVDFNDKLVTVVGKGNKTRIVPVGRKALESLQEWFKHRDLVEAKGKAIFISQQGQRLTGRAVRMRVEAMGKSKLGRHLYPHMLRHSFATDMLSSCHDLRVVQELLGHADIKTTQIYTHLDYGHLAGVYNNAHPRAKRITTDSDIGKSHEL